MSTVIVKRFVRVFDGGRCHYSIRRRCDRLFQFYEHVPYLNISQPYQLEDQPISGIYMQTLHTQKRSILRMRPDLEPEA